MSVRSPRTWRTSQGRGAEAQEGVVGKEAGVTEKEVGDSGREENAVVGEGADGKEEGAVVLVSSRDRVSVS